MNIPADATLPSGRAPHTSSHHRWLRPAIATVTGAYIAWLALTNWTDLSNAVLRIGRASGSWIIAGIAIEAVAQIAGGLLLRQLLSGAGHQLTKRSAIGLAVAQNAVGLVVPGGPVAGAAFAYKHLRRRGLDSSAIVWVLAGASVASNLVIVALGLVAYAGTSTWSFTPLVSLAMLITLAGYLALAVRRPALVGPPARLWYTIGAVVRRRPRDTVDARVAALEERLGTVQLSRSDWLKVLLFAIITVAADCAALVFCTRALVRLPARCTSGATLTARAIEQCTGFRRPSLTRIVLVYAAGQATLSLPFIPGGLGPVEAAMTVTFVAGHIRPVAALSAVLLYRLVSYWGVLLFGMFIFWRLQRNQRPRPAPS